jgi:protein-arginine kinase activator protein McsA
VTSSIFSFIVDAAIQNAFSINRLLDVNDKRQLSDYKLDIALQMMQSAGAQRAQQGESKEEDNEVENEVVITGTKEATLNTNLIPRKEWQVGASDAAKEVLSGVGCNNSAHQLVNLQQNKSGRCFLCALNFGSVAGKTNYGCMACKKAFHINCFSIFHSSNFGGLHDEVVAIVNDSLSDNKKKRNFSKVSSMLPSSLEDIEGTFKKKPRRFQQI